MKYYLTVVVALFTCFSVNAASLDVPMNLLLADGSVKSVGTITISETQYGLLFTPQLQAITAGIHGFHVHEKPNCAAIEKNGKLILGQAAGGHLDPNKTNKHLGPYNNNGHLGDLPALYVDQNGVANYAVLAPRLTKLDQVKNHSLMIHIGGDNYSDHPAALGGGGARLVCGVIK